MSKITQQKHEESGCTDYLQHNAESCPTMASASRANGCKGGRPKVLQIILPRVESMMSGVFRILKAHDLVTMEYTDGTRESGNIPTERWDEIK